MAEIVSSLPDDEAWLYGESSAEKEIQQIEKKESPDRKDEEVENGEETYVEAVQSKMEEKPDDATPTQSEAKENTVTDQGLNINAENVSDDELEEDEDEDGVQVTIGDLVKPSAFPYAGRGFNKPTAFGRKSFSKGLDLQHAPLYNNTSLYELKIEELTDKPWRVPGADISEYFNYGFNETTWTSYCERQKKLIHDNVGLRLNIGPFGPEVPKLLSLSSNSNYKHDTNELSTSSSNIKVLENRSTKEELSGAGNQAPPTSHISPPVAGFPLPSNSMPLSFMPFNPNVPPPNLSRVPPPGFPPQIASFNGMSGDRPPFPNSSFPIIYNNSSSVQHNRDSHAARDERGYSKDRSRENSREISLNKDSRGNDYKRQRMSSVERSRGENRPRHRSRETSRYKSRERNSSPYHRKSYHKRGYKSRRSSSRKRSRSHDRRHAQKRSRTKERSYSRSRKHHHEGESSSHHRRSHKSRKSKKADHVDSLSSAKARKSPTPTSTNEVKNIVEKFAISESSTTEQSSKIEVENENET